MVGLAGAWIASIIGFFPTWSIIYDIPPEEDRAFGIAAYIRDQASREEWVILDGLGWNPSFLYYARRQGIAVPDHAGFQDTSGIELDAILADPIFGPRITCDQQGACAAESAP